MTSLFRQRNTPNGVHTIPFMELEEHPQALFDAVLAAHPLWLTRRATEVAAGRVGPDVTSPAVAEATRWLSTELSSFLSTDVDEQRMNPLQIIRQSTRPVAAVLRAAGVPEPVRDEFEQRGMPEDPYGFGPLTWQDMGDDVHEAGITWGAWKAATFLTRRRAEGRA